MNDGGAHGLETEGRGWLCSEPPEPSAHPGAVLCSPPGGTTRKPDVPEKGGNLPELPRQPLSLFPGLGPGTENEGAGEWALTSCLSDPAQDAFRLPAGMAQPAGSQGRMG